MKWRSFEILSKDALIQIIGILLNEIESTRKSDDGKRGSEQPKSFPKKQDYKTGKSKRICWYFNNSTCKFGKFCWNLHRRVEKLDKKKSPQKRNGKLKSRKTLEKTSEKSESLKEAVLDSTNLKLSKEEKSMSEEKSSECKSKESVFEEVTDTVECAQAEPPDNKQKRKDLLAQEKSTAQEPMKGATSCPDDETSTEDPDHVKHEDEQDNATESKQQSDLTSIRRKKTRKSKKCCKENDIQQSDERNHAEINNVISDKDASDLVDKILAKINAVQLSEGREEKNQSYSKKKGKKNICKKST